MNTFKLRLGVLLREAVVAVLTGLITFGINMVLTPGSAVVSAAFALVAAAAASALDTLYFHLLFLLRRAPTYTAEYLDQHGLEEVHRRLLDGSMQMREALIRRFESDYGRTAAIPRSAGGSRRQLREAKRRLRARLWVVERVITASQWLAAAGEAKSNPEALEKWTVLTDEMADAYLQVLQRQGFLSAMGNTLLPQRLTAQTRAEWKNLAPEAH